MTAKLHYLLGVGLLVGAAAACRPDPGIPDYSSHTGLRDRANAAEEELPGPNPYVLGDRRLYIGGGYEGGRSDEVLINEVDTFYFIFDTAGDGSGMLTYVLEPDGDRIEGKVSDAIILTGAPFWGGGLIWTTARDLSEWTTMYISLKSSDEAFADFGIVTQSEGAGGGTEDFRLNASEYGFVNDGEWHNLRIPLEDFGGLDLGNVRSPLILTDAVQGVGGETLLVDDVYYTAE